MDTTRDLTPVVPKKLRNAFFMLVACFALWGLLNNMTDNLVPAFERIFSQKPSDSAGVQIAFYGAYAVLAIFAAMLIEEFSYRTGVLIGLGFYIVGALIYLPACGLQDFNLFLAGIFILASGLSVLETTCNPYVLAMGPGKTAVRRLNFAQAFNPIGSLGGIILAKFMILSNLNTAGVEERAALKASDPAALASMVHTELFWVCVPYVGLIVVAAAIWFYFWRNKTATQAYTETNPTQDAPKGRISLIGLYLACVAVAVGAIIALDKCMSIQLDMVGQLLVVMAGPIAFMLIVKSYRTILCQLLSIPRYLLGVIAQFFYVGIQIGAWTWMTKYCMKELGLAEAPASTYYLLTLISFMLGRWVATYFMKRFNPASMMAYFAVAGVLCCAGAMYLPSDMVLFTVAGVAFPANVLCLVLTSACMSLMFPTIYGIALGGLNEKQRKLGASGLIMAIIGGAIITPWMATIAQADNSIFFNLMPTSMDSTMDANLSCSSLSVRAAYAVPALSFVVILLYSLAFRKPVNAQN